MINRVSPKLTTFLRNPKLLSILAAGSGQILMLIATALVARNYSEAQISEYGIFFTLVNMVSIGAMLRLEQGIIYEKQISDVEALLKACFLVTIPVLVISSVIIFAYFSINPQTMPHAGVLTLLSLLSVLFLAFTKSLVQLAARLDQFRSIALSYFMRPSWVALLQLCAVFAGAGFLKLPIAFLLAQFLLFISIFLLVRRHVNISKVLAAGNNAINAIKKNKQFIFYNLPQNMLYVLSEALVPLSLSFLFPEHTGAVALFWLASRVVFAPATIVAESLRSIIYRETAKKAGQKLAKYIFRVSVFFSFLMFIPVIVLVFFGEHIFDLVFGIGWGKANDYAIILAVLAASNMVMLPVVGALPVIGLMKEFFVYELVALISRAIILFSISWGSPLEALLFSTMTYIAILAVFFSRVMIKLFKPN